MSYEPRETRVPSITTLCSADTLELQLLLIARSWSLMVAHSVRERRDKRAIIGEVLKELRRLKGAVQFAQLIETDWF